MTLTREAITKSVIDRLDLSKASSAKAVAATFEIIKKSLEGGEDVLISGFGKFCVKDKGRRRVRNPGTGEDMMLAERRVVTFKSSPVLKGKLNWGAGVTVREGTDHLKREPKKVARMSSLDSCSLIRPFLIRRFI